MQQKQDEILKILLSLSEEEQNKMMMELNLKLRQERIKKVWDLEEESRRIKWSLNSLS